MEGLSVLLFLILLIITIPCIRYLFGGSDGKCSLLTYLIGFMFCPIVIFLALASIIWNFLTKTKF